MVNMTKASGKIPSHLINYSSIYIYASLNHLQPRACYRREQHLTDKLILITEGACKGAFVTSMNPDTQDFMRILTITCTQGPLTVKNPSTILTTLHKIRVWTEPEHQFFELDVLFLEGA